MIEHLIFIAGVTAMAFGIFLMADQVRARLGKTSRGWDGLLFSLTFGLMAAGCIQFGHEISAGVIIDARGAVLAVATIAGGWSVGAAAAVIATLSRLTIGGAGVWAGGAGIGLDFLVAAGLVWVWQGRQKGWAGQLSLLALCGLGVGCVEALSLRWIGEAATGEALFRSTGWSLFITQVVCTLLLGSLIHLQRERRRSREVLLTALATSLDGFVLLGLDGRVREVNQALEAMTGYSRAELLGLSLHQLKVGSSAAEAIRWLAELNARGQHRFVSRWRRKDGTEIDLEVAATAAPEAIGGIYSFVHDITHRHRMEADLQASRNQLQSLLDNLPDPAWLKDAAGRYQAVNAPWCRFFGVPPATVLGHTAGDFLPAEVARQWAAEEQALLTRRLPLKREDCITAAGGEPRWYEIWMSALWDAQGAPQGLVGIARDITERRLAEGRLLESERRYRLVAESSSDVIWLYNLASQQFEFVSPAVERLRGYTAAETLRQSFAETLTPESHRLVTERLGPRIQALEAGDESARVRTTEMVHTRRDGTTFPAEAVTTLVTDPAGRVTHIQGVSRDITERQKAEAERQQLNRALRARSACNRALVHALKEGEFMEQVCRLLVEEGGYRLAWVGCPLSDAAKSVRLVAQAGCDEGYLAGLNITWADTDRGRGPTGTCLRTRQPVVTRNVATDPNFAPWRQSALARGYASSAALPLVHQQELLGALMVYAVSPEGFDGGEVALLTELADDLALGIAMLRVRVARAAAEAALEKRLRYERALSALSASLREAPAVAGVLAETLSLLLRTSGMDRASLFENHDDPERGWCLTRIREVAREGLEPALGQPLCPDLPYREASPSGLLLQRFLNRDPVRGPVSSLPPGERQFMEAQGVQDFLILPIFAGGQFWGFLGLGDCTTSHRFDDLDESLLRNAANLLGWHLAAACDREALRASEQAHRQFIESLPDGVYRSTHAGRFLEVNPAMVSILGYDSKAELMAIDIKSQLYFAEQDRESAALEEKQSEMSTFRLRKKDGSEIWVEDHGRHVLDGQGNILWHEGVLRDVTLRVRAERALNELNQRLEERVRERTAEALDLYHQAPCGYHSLGPDGLVLQMNDTELRWLGRTREEVEGRLSYASLMPPASAERFSQAFPGFAARGAEETVEWELCRRDGPPLTVLVTSTALRDAQGRFLRTRATVVDITGRNQAEQALREGRQRLAGILEGTNVGTWEWNIQTGEVAVNERWAEIKGFSLAELAPVTIDTVLRLVHPEDVPVSQAVLEKHCRHELDYYEFEGRMRHKDGHWVWVWEHGKVMRWTADGLPLLMQGTQQDITSRKHLEAVLRESEEKFRVLYESSRDALVTTDLAGRCLECNPAAVAVFGCTDQADLMARWPVELCPARQPDGRESGPAFAEVIQRCLAEGSLFFEWCHQRKDGGEFPAEVVISVAEIHGRKVLHGAVRDISRRKQAEQALRASEAKFRQLVEMAPLPMALTDPAGAVQLINSQFTRMLGYTTADMPNTEAWWSLAYPDAAYRGLVRQQWEVLVERAAQGTGQLPPTEYQVAGRDGRVHTLLISGTVLKDGFLAAFLDITQLKEANDTLRKLSQAVEFSPSMIIITDQRGLVEYANPAWERVTGFRLAEVAGKKPAGLKSGVHSREFYAHLWSEITAGRIWRGEFCNRRKNGELYWESAAIAPVHDDAGRITHFVAVKEDITDRRKAEEELRLAKEAADAANRAKSTFLANMSHEIRTPMNAILGFAQLLHRDPDLSSQHRAQLATISRSGEHLMEIINDILEMARIESGRIALNPDTFDLHRLLEDLERLFSLRAEASQLGFQVERQGTVPRWILADETRLRQVLINLLGNAVKFTPAGGSIILRVSATEEPDRTLLLHMEVEDTGKGIAPEDMPHLFQAFFQTQTGKQVAGGTGLGLAISREFVRLMGGDMTVASRLGAGSSFRFDVRVAPGDEAAARVGLAQAPRALHLVPGLAACRVLVVDDRPENCDLLKRLLTQTGFEIRTAGGGVEALETARQWVPHLVLLDLRMPGMDGYEVARHLREAQGQDVRVLALSASVFAEDHQKALDAGADAFMAKPFQQAELLECIKELAGVEYVYENAGPVEAAVPASPSPKLPSTEEISQLPAELVAELRDAISRAAFDQMLDLAGQVAALNEPLGRRMQQLVEQFDYRTLQKMLALPGS
jgi:two-component system sensor histidine kinase/response regulator